MTDIFNNNDILNTLNSKQLKAFETIINENKYFRKLFQVSYELSTSDLTTILQLIINSIVDITGVKRGYLMLITNSQKLTFKTIACTDADYTDDNEREISETIARNVYKSGKPELIRNAEIDPEYKSRESIARLNLKAILCVPLKIKDKIIGVIYVDSDSFIDSFSDYGIKLFEAFASQAAIAIENARLIERLKKENIFLKKEIEGPYKFGEIICQSEKMKNIMQMLNHILDNNVTILVLGETGTGKELIARAIHYNSIRKQNRFIAQNCAALPENLLESELFGYKKGAFTGAATDKAGLFEAADGGTIFLDEIGETSLAVQVRLLRILEDKMIRRIGENHNRKIDVRIIAATNRDLSEEVKRGRFREDLYYRLNVFPVNLPPLRERTDDIPLLVQHFINVYNKKLNKQIEYVSKSFMDTMLNNAWPGNIRELKNYIYRLMILVPSSRKELHENAIISSSGEKESVQSGEKDTEHFKSLADMEKHYIEEVLQACNNNQTKTAKILGLKRSTLYSKMQKLQITIPKKNPQ